MFSQVDKLDTISSKFFNNHQIWKFNINLVESSCLFVWPCKIFLTEFINDWSREQPLDLYNYVPVTYEFIIDCTRTEIFIPGKSIIIFFFNITRYRILFFNFHSRKLDYNIFFRMFSKIREN